MEVVVKALLDYHCQRDRDCNHTLLSDQRGYWMCVMREFACPSSESISNPPAGQVALRTCLFVALRVVHDVITNG